ncbi:class I adenylate-forming enzyme family protein [Cribrihabitans pelagius]|uniref:class I adenylate-forming enzyme family protein n=1 Tax=Cribrihabitans pelagius TaxID=1765746 RepID=UPI003B5A5A22
MLALSDPAPFAPCPSPFNLAAYVLRHAERLAEKTALSVLAADGAEDWSYARLEASVRGTGTGLLHAGLRRGDMVLLRLGNTVEFPVAYLGAIAAGLVPVPTSPQLTEPEVARILTGLKPAAVLRDPAIPCPRHPHQITRAELSAMQALPPCRYTEGDPERLAYVVYTSGTSGSPRAVAHAHRAIWARRMMVKGWYGLTSEDRLLHAGAFNWTFTLGTGLMDPWANGAAALIPGPDTPPEALPALLKRHRATLFAAAPGVYRKMLTHLPLDLPDLRHGLSAGEKLPAHLLEAWVEATGKPLYEAYGMSECSTFISAAPEAPAEDGTLGRPQPGRQVAILGSDGVLERGAEGTIAIHRSDPGLMLGYLNAAEETAARFQGDWFLTGDQGAMTESGAIRYLGRNDDMMNAGGYRVSPIEVETALAAHPGITQAGVAAVEVKPDTYIIAAFYTGPEELNAADLAAFASARLARYKQPRAYIRLDTLPAGANGKLLRRALPACFKGKSA